MSEQTTAKERSQKTRINPCKMCNKYPDGRISYDDAGPGSRRYRVICSCGEKTDYFDIEDDAVENWNAANPAPESSEQDRLSQLEAENKSLRAEKEEYAKNLRAVCKVIEENPFLKMAFNASVNTMETEENKPA